MPLIDGRLFTLSHGIKGLTTLIPALNNWLLTTQNIGNIPELCFLNFIKIKDSGGPENEDSGQFINLEELSKLIKKS
jgi:CBS domain-containing protein